MGKTKTQIQERHAQILVELDKIEELAQRENRLFTSEEEKKYDALIREDNRLHVEIQGLLDERELSKFNEQKSLNAQLRETIKKCGIEKRAVSTTILAFKDTDASPANTTANLEAGELIPIEIKPIIDTKVPGIELPDSLMMATGVTGTQVVPYSINDVTFSVEGEVSQVAEQALDFAHIKAVPQRVAASVPVSFRAIDNAAFDILSFINYKFSKGWAIFRALHVYAHGEYTKLQSPFAQVDVEEITLDGNFGVNLSKKIAEMYDLGFEGDPEIIMDKVTETDLKFTKLIPGTTDSNRTVVEGGRCVGYNYKVSPYIDYAINSSGVASKDATYRYIGIGHFGYLAEQQHGEFRFNVDGTSSANFDRGTVCIGMSTDYSLTELSSKINANDSGKPQAFKLLKLIVPPSSSEIG